MEEKREREGGGRQRRNVGARDDAVDPHEVHFHQAPINLASPTRGAPFRVGPLISRRWRGGLHHHLAPLAAASPLTRAGNVSNRGRASDASIVVVPRMGGSFSYLRYSFIIHQLLYADMLPHINHGLGVCFSQRYGDNRKLKCNK
jgi:hypothetical protein